MNNIMTDQDIIPKTIFQTWKSKTVLPDNMKYWQSTWTKYNENYNYVLWDDDDNRKFIKEHYPWFLKMYDMYNVNIKRVDAIRYFYLYHYGGIYADLDFECLKNFDDLIEKTNNDIILGKMVEIDHNSNDHNMPNALMISKPRVNFWLCVFYLLIQRCMTNQSPEYCTGPILLKDAYKLYNGEFLKSSNYQRIKTFLSESLKPRDDELIKLKLCDPEIFYPVDWRFNEGQDVRKEVVHNKNIYDQDTVKLKFPNSYAVTYWTHTW